MNPPSPNISAISFRQSYATNVPTLVRRTAACRHVSDFALEKQIMPPWPDCPVGNVVDRPATSNNECLEVGPVDTSAITHNHQASHKSALPKSLRAHTEGFRTFRSLTISVLCVNSPVTFGAVVQISAVGDLSRACSGSINSALFRTNYVIIAVKAAASNNMFQRPPYSNNC